MELSSFWFALYKFVKFAVYPYTWLAVLLGGATLVAFLPLSPTRLRWLRILLAAALFIVWVLGNPLVSALALGALESYYPPFDQSASRGFDAVVVLGGGVQAKGSLRPTDQLSGLSTQRTICGADLFLQGHASRLVLVGGPGSIFRKEPREAVEMKRLAMKLGVPEDAILLEDRSRTTYENAVGAKGLLGHGSILLVSSASHMPRAVAIFRSQGFEVTPAPCVYTVQERPGSGWDWDSFGVIPNILALYGTTLAVAEVTGTIVYWITGKL